MNSELVSVIVPAYNVESRIGKCLQSIIEQSYSNIEVIVVNDGSTDATENVIAEYVAKDNRIRLIEHPKNKGLFQARITGVEQSSGEFIIFVDSDDTISLDWIRMLLFKCNENNADVAIGDFVLEYPDGSKKYHSLDPIRAQNIELTGDAVLSTFMSQQGSFYGWHTVWNKMYSRALWKKFLPQLKEFSQSVGRLIMTEDVAFSSLVYTHASKIVNIHNAYYNYYKGNSSSTADINELSKFLSCISDIKNVFTFFKKNLSAVSKFSQYEKEYYEWLKLYGRIYWEKLENINCPLRKRSKIQNDLLAFFHMSQGESQRKSDWMLYSELTDLKSFKWYEEIKRYICLEYCTHVSFDIFDTLVVRPFFKPTDLFELMDYYYTKLTNGSSPVWFSKMRVDSEAKARKVLIEQKAQFEEITLEDIYERLSLDYSIPPEILSQLKELEIDLEIKYCSLRNAARELYELARYKGKKILATSDMYLSSDTVNAILSKCGYQVDSLYLSSEVKLTKFTGNLYKYLLEKEQIDEPSKLCHIGDNWGPDIEMAQKKGIKAYHLAKTTDMLCNYNPGIYSGELYNHVMFPKSVFVDEIQAFNSFLGLRCVWALVANKIFDNPYVSFREDSDFNLNPYYIGYAAVGMHMLAIYSWLSSFKEIAGSTIHFVARDGYLPKLVFDILNKDDSVKTDYLRVSRKSLVIADISNTSDLYSIYRKINVLSISPIETVKMLALLFDNKTYCALIGDCKKIYVAPEDNFDSFEKYYQFMKFLIDEYGSKMDFEEKDRRMNAIFKSVLKKGDSIFDVGYGGRTESALSHIMEFPIDSYYIHINSDVANQRSQLYGLKNNCFYDYKPAITGVMREHIMMEMAPSTIGYDYNKNELVPLLESDYSIDYPSYIMTKIIQDAALDLAKDYKKYFGEEEAKIYFRKEDLSMAFEYYLHSSKYSDRLLFSNLAFEDQAGEGRSFNALDFWNGEIGRITSERQIKPRVGSINRDVLISYISSRLGERHLVSKGVVKLMNLGFILLDKFLYQRKR